MDAKTSNRSHEGGFSLIEVMIAVLILTVGLLALAQMMVIATNANAISGRATASAALAKEQLELLKAAPFYTDPNNIPGSLNPVLGDGGSIEADTEGYSQFYDADGQPVNAANQATYVVRWLIQTVVPFGGGDGNPPLWMKRITVRCMGLAQAYRVVGETTLVTFRTANIG